MFTYFINFKTIHAVTLVSINLFQRPPISVDEHLLSTVTIILNPNIKNDNGLTCKIKKD